MNFVGPVAELGQRPSAVHHVDIRELPRQAVEHGIQPVNQYREHFATQIALDAGRGEGAPEPPVLGSPERVPAILRPSGVGKGDVIAMHQDGQRAEADVAADRREDGVVGRMKEIDSLLEFDVIDAE